MTLRDRVERLSLLGKAEQLLIDAAPIFPLFHLTYNYMKKKDVNGIYFSELGYLDLRHAYRGQ
jgi:oligopeptide transport system substrate-binding protein